MDVKSKDQEKIWAIRDKIQLLEDIKDKIIEYLNSKSNLDNGTETLWVSDVKECYFSVVATWELLWGSTLKNEQNINSSKGYLYNARNFCAKIISELKVFDDKKAFNLASELKDVFEKCWDAMFPILEEISLTREIKPPSEHIIKVSEKEYNFPCSVCGDISVIFRIGKGRFDKNDMLVFRGITHESSLNKDLARELFEILERGNLSEVHGFMKRYHAYEGLDAYCPECDKIYCWEHYNAREEYDDGFYDCTYGTCSEGHKRMIDD